MKRPVKNPGAWTSTPAGLEAYRVARFEAQAKANLFGMDHGVERNDLFKTFRVFMLPGRQFRQGHETRCEVVHPDHLAKCKPGHGP